MTLGRVIRDGLRLREKQQQRRQAALDGLRCELGNGLEPAWNSRQPLTRCRVAGSLFLLVAFVL
jgi:hypothetical protein